MFETFDKLGLDHLHVNGVNGCQETLFFGCEDAVSDIGGVWIVMPSMPMPDRPEGGQASARGLAGWPGQSVEVMVQRRGDWRGRLSRARVACLV